MAAMKWILIFLFFPVTFMALSQNVVKGLVVDEEGNPIAGVTIGIKGTKDGVVTNNQGLFRLEWSEEDSTTLIFSHVSYNSLEIVRLPGLPETVEIVLTPKSHLLTGIEVQGDGEERQQPGLLQINPIALKSVPGPFNDFSAVLKTLPGVVSNNEFSSSYSVRGGNYDENLVFVNGIPVYRPFLISNGRQEGLGFVNPDLVETVTFSSGAWESRYGGKNSSVLDIQYKKPKDFILGVTGGLLGGSVHLEAGNDKVTFIGGIRRKSSRYLYNTLDVKGQYRPHFTDFQSYTTVKLGSKTSLGFLTAWSSNRYQVFPENRNTEFGTFGNPLRLFVAFEGSEIMEYDTYQMGINLIHELTENWKMSVAVSGVQTREREFKNIEGGYRLCDVNKDTSSDTFGECLSTRGIGTNFEYARNLLTAGMGDILLSNAHTISERHLLEWGLVVSTKMVKDQIREYTFLDSSDYVNNVQPLYVSNEVTHDQYAFYIQDKISNDRVRFSYGLRANYVGLTGEVLYEPRIQVSWQPYWKKDILFKVGTGIHYQLPVYREFRSRIGELNKDIKSQGSFHVIAGFDYNLSLWERPFKWTFEAYSKSLWNVVAYDVDNVRIFYFADNNAKAWAYGGDMRFGGEFITGTESWFSLGVLSTKEDIANDHKGYIRRPLDQRVTAGALFQDYFPNNPTMKVAMNLQFGSGLPFGPPGNIENRAVFTGSMYRRIDLGFTKEWSLKLFDMMLTAEVLNLLGANNTITYTWIRDLSGHQIAVPNGLSQRFFNIKLRVVVE
ncbi:MAG: carboxypeptidase-like regulatory domain-containing protein [Cyclobacteriaceae bacterium]|nr:carboxypeptidase-like regulatory domain-containing protein [Cyclobacteriaceae bacterium]